MAFLIDKKCLLCIWHSEDRASWYTPPPVFDPRTVQPVASRYTDYTTRRNIIIQWNQRDGLISQIYFWNRTLHVSGSFSVLHQESSTVHTPISICHTQISKMGKITSVYIYIYTGCPRRNVPDFWRVFLMLKYTDITQNTYVQSWTVTEIMAREVWNFDSCYTLVDCQIHIKTGRNMWFL